MKKNIMKKWVKALKSGKYKQSQNILENYYGYCCLGVLCKVAEKNKIRVNKHKLGDLKGSSLTSQKNVLKWSGMRTGLGDIEIVGTTLSSLNDRGKSFKQIANVIEKYWKEL